MIFCGEYIFEEAVSLILLLFLLKRRVVEQKERRICR